MARDGIASKLGISYNKYPTLSDCNANSKKTEKRMLNYTLGHQ